MSNTPLTQPAIWNGPAGQVWAESQTLLDQMFEPFEALLDDWVAGHGGRRVLDIGCGTGAISLAVARRARQCTGIDISAPMLAIARARAQGEGRAIDFIEADAQRHAFAPGAFDTLVSRLGVMFFDDPAAAFANLHRAATPDARMALIAWRSPAENPFMTAAEAALPPSLLTLPPRQPGGPGQFGFADRQKAQRILEGGGWQGIDIQPFDVSCAFPEAALAAYLTRFGPLGLALHDADPSLRERVVAAIRPAFAPYVHGDEVRFTAACWWIEARA